MEDRGSEFRFRGRSHVLKTSFKGETTSHFLSKAGVAGEAV